VIDNIVVGDCHIKENAIDELDSIFSEIITYKSKKLIILGDYYHSNRPTGKELEFGTRWIDSFRNLYEEVVLIKGNHEASSDNCTCVDYLRYLNIGVVDTYIKDDCYFAHHFLSESELAFGTGKYSIADLKDYRYVLLGHQHKFQELAPNMYHLGAVRKCDFGEAFYSQPRIALFKDGELEFKELKSPSQIIICSHPNELKGLNENSRILYIFNSFEQFLNEIGEVNIQKPLFKELKMKMNFKKDDKKYEKNENQSFKELFQAFLENLAPDVKKELEEVIEYEI